MSSGDTHFLLLYLVCVFQPITRQDLFKEAVRAAATGSTDALDLRIASEALKELIKRQLVLEDKGLISSTVLGNQRAAKLGLRRVRDKNRLFFLKHSLRRDYNEDR
jgi:hypothetical protein